MKEKERFVRSALILTLEKMTKKWLKHIEKIYDERISLDFINRHHQLSFFTLNQNQYLSDIIDDLYWKKEHYDFYTIHNDDCLKD